MKKYLVFYFFIFYFNFALAGPFYFAIGANVQASVEAFNLFNKDSGTFLDESITLKDLFSLDKLDFGFASKDSSVPSYPRINNASNKEILRSALKDKLSPIFSSGFQAYLQIGTNLVVPDLYLGFELAFGFNLGRTIFTFDPKLNLGDDFVKDSYDFGIIPRLFLKYDNFWFASTLFVGFGDKSLISDPLYVGNLNGGKINSPFEVFETGARVRLSFLSLESSVSFTVTDFVYRDWRVGVGFEVPILK